MLDLNLISQLRPIMAPQTVPQTKPGQVEGVGTPVPGSAVAAIFDQFNTGLGQIGSALTNIDVLDESGLAIAFVNIAAHVVQATQELKEIKNMIDLMAQIALKLNAGGLSKAEMEDLLQQLAKIQEVAAKYGIDVKVEKSTDAAGNVSYEFVMARNNSHYSSTDPDQMKAFLTALTREFLRESIKREGSLDVDEQYLKKLEEREDVKNDPEKQKAIEEMRKQIKEGQADAEDNREGFRTVAKASGYTDEQIDAMIQQTEAEAMLALVKEIGQQKQIQDTVKESSLSSSNPSVEPQSHAPLMIIPEAFASYSEESDASSYRAQQQQTEQKQQADELDYLMGVYEQKRQQEQKQQRKQEEERYQADKQQEQAYILRALGQP